MHALLTCPERQYARIQFPPDLQLAKASLSPRLLKLIGEYISRTRTGYPPTPPSSPILSPLASQTPPHSELCCRTMPRTVFLLDAANFLVLCWVNGSVLALLVVGILVCSCFWRHSFVVA
jgi:hypothetical protein